MLAFVFASVFDVKHLGLSGVYVLGRHFFQIAYSLCLLLL